MAASSRGRRAFTLIELLTVIAIIAILAGITFGVVGAVKQRAAVAQTKAELGVLSAALEGYKRQYGDYPQTADGAVLLLSLIGKKGPTGTDITGRAQIDMALFHTADGKDPFNASDAVLVDPWEQPYIYIYKVPSAGWTNPSFVLFSAGPDGALTLPFPSDGIKTPTYDAALKNGAAVNADNLYANQ